MGLPIAIGGKSLSSRAIAPPSPIAEDADDGTTRLEPHILFGGNSMVTMAVSPDQKLSMTCTISYYEMRRHNTNTVDHCIADVCLQVAPLGEAYSSSYRDVLHRIQLPALQKRETSGDTSSSSSSQRLLLPSVVFANDGRHAACLIPHCHDFTQSMVVVFQLRKPRATASSNNPPPRPSYLGTPPQTKSSLFVPVATNPRIVQLDDEVVLTTASCVCDASTHPTYKHGSSMLLIGCVDGRILAASYRPARVAGLLFCPKQQQHDTRTSTTATTTISSMSHLTLQWKETDGARGRLVALLQPSGMAVIFQSHLILDVLTSTTTATGEPDSPQSQQQSQRTRRPSADYHVMVSLEPWIDLDGPFSRAKWIAGSAAYLACLCRPSRDHVHAAAEVWALPSSDRAAEPISTLTMTSERLNEYQHGTFSVDTTENKDERLNDPDLHEASCLQYDEESGCLSVSSWILSPDSKWRPFSCIWNWRTNVVGLTLAARKALKKQESLLSHFYFGHDTEGGKRLIHVIAEPSWIRKEMYDVGILSPPNAAGAIGHACTEASSLLLSSKSVTFPVVRRPLVGDEGEVEWMESRIPTHYTSVAGVPRIAAIGQKRCRSIAVAGSRGMCILDCARVMSRKRGDRSGRMGVPKWRLFGSEMEERSFRILAMTWWEGDDPCDGGSSECLTDDLLVAVIQEQAEIGGGRVYLASWSRRRLDMQNQLLLPVESRRGTLPLQTMGTAVPLVHFGACSISLLSDPKTSNDDCTERKAAVMISIKGESDNENQNTNYFLYQLQCSPIRDRDRDSGDVRSSFCIYADLCSQGLISPSAYAIPSSVFLASCSFQFDLLKQRPSTEVDPHRYLATVAIVYAAGMGVDAVVISPSGPTVPAHIIYPTESDQDTPLKSSEVSSFWISQTIVGFVSSADHHSHSSIDSFFAWAILMRDGTLFCWNVPFFDSRHSEVNTLDDGVEYMKDLPYDDRNGLAPPVFVCSSEDDDAALPLLFGTIATIGDSSTWLQEASNANRVHFSLGCLPSSKFGCVLRCAQGARNLHRVAPSDTECGTNAPSFLDHEIFCLGDSAMAPPAFISSVYASLLGAANEHALCIYEGRTIPRGWDSRLLKKMTLSALKSHVSDDTITTALRILILRVVESVAREASKPRSDSVMLATSLFAELVDAVRSLVSPMQFVSLFLGVARQIEPSCIPHLFPLPLSTNAFRNDADPIQRWRTVDDLFLASLYYGSLSSPSSALPLFSSKRITLNKCIQLLKRCLRAFEDGATFVPSIVLDSCPEERGVIRDLFLFGTKLEDAGLGPVVDGRPPRRPFLESNENGPGHEDMLSLSTTASSFVNVKAPQQGRGRRKRRSICHLLLPSIITGKYQNAHEEDAIHEAASSFISSGFEESDYEFVPLTQASVPLEITYEDMCELSVAGTIVDFLLSLCLDHKPVKPYYRWKKARALARILLGEDSSRETIDESSSLVIGFKNLSALVPLSAFSVLAKATRRKHDESKENKELVAELLTAKIRECDSELDTKDALLVLRLVCVLLSRHDKSRDVESCISGIIFLGVVTGHVAGVAKQLLGQTFQLSAIGSSYSVALEELEDSRREETNAR